MKLRARNRKPKAEAETVTVSITLPKALFEDLDGVLAARDTTISKFVEVQARSYMRMPLEFELHTQLPFRKYSGTPLEDVIRLDPNYVRWVAGNVANFRMSERCWSLLNRIDPSGE